MKWEDKEECRFTGMYGWFRKEEKKFTLGLMKRLAEESHNEWVCMEDFNIILHPEDKVGVLDWTGFICLSLGTP